MGWNFSYTSKSIGFVLILFLSSLVIFPGKMYGIEWLLAAFLICFFVFYNIQTFQKRWNKYSNKTFISRLFWVSFSIRISVMLILLLISYSTWNMFYYVGAMDEMKYFRIASEAAEIFKTAGISPAYAHILETYLSEISDTGFCTFQSFLFIMFGYAPILFKMLYCFIGSYTVVRLYKLTLILFEEPVARLSAILFMLFPIAWFFSVVIMKETTMTFLIVESIYQTVKLQRSYKTSTLIKLLSLIIILFFFRSAISILLVMGAAFSMFMQVRKKHLVVNILVTAFLLGGFYYFLQSTGKAEKYYQQYTETDAFVEQRLITGSKVNPYTSVVNAPLYFSISLFAPFPSYVSVPVSFGRGIPHDEYYYHVAGCMVWVIMAFFSIVGLYHAIRYRRQELAPVWIFILGYQLVLLRSILFTSVRFTYPIKPFLFMMAAYGVYKLKSKKWFTLYLVAAFIMIIGWNYVRLKGRGV
jgi:hypothetical protein